MIKIWLLLFSFSLFARENPFFPINSELDIPLTSQELKKAPMLKRATLSLPSTAREIQSITVTYKNLDGTIAKKSVDLQNSIDWHLPIFISQNYNLTEKTQTQSQQTRKRRKFKKFTSLGFITFYTNDKTMKIETTDKLLRSFLLVKPHRIVCDFKRETDLRSYVKKAKDANIFQKITVGTHRGYYRVVIELDGSYRYTIEEESKGYLVVLH